MELDAVQQASIRFSFFAIMTAAAKLPAHVVSQASKSSPNLLHEIFYGIGLGIFGKPPSLSDAVSNSSSLYTRIDRGI